MIDLDLGQRLWWLCGVCLVVILWWWLAAWMYRGVHSVLHILYGAGGLLWSCCVTCLCAAGHFRALFGATGAADIVCRIECCTA